MSRLVVIFKNSWNIKAFLKLTGLSRCGCCRLLVPAQLSVSFLCALMISSRAQTSTATMIDGLFSSVLDILSCRSAQLHRPTSPTRCAAITEHWCNGENGLSVYISTKRLHWTVWKHSSINQPVDQSTLCPFHLTDHSHKQHSTTGMM